MNFDLNETLDAVKEGVQDLAETAHKKTNLFHENYLSKIIPDCGKYGDTAKFFAEMIPGVSEYNAIKDGDWVAFGIAAGFDLAALAAGAFTFGAGYAAMKGGGTAAKTLARTAVKEVLEAGSETAVREVTEKGVKNALQEISETGAKSLAREIAEKGAREAAEAGAKEVSEAGAKSAMKEMAEEGMERAAKEAVEEGTEQAAKETAEHGVKNIDDIGNQITRNKLDGTAREEKVLDDLVSKNGEDNVIREALVRDQYGTPIKDPQTGEARRLDFVVTQNNKVLKAIEVTSETADKTLQFNKQARIFNEAANNGGAFIKDRSGNLLELTIDDIELWRLP